MKIVFVVPEYLSGRSFLQPPVDILLTNKLLQNEGWEVFLIDNRIEKLSLRELSKKIRLIDPNILIITTSPYDVSQNYFVEFRIYIAEKTISFLKHAFPNVPIIVTGPHGSIRPSILLNDINYSADIIIRWEYDLVLSRILKILESYNFDINKSIRRLKRIPNLVIVFKNHNKKKVIKTEYSKEKAHPNNYPIVPQLDLINKYKNNYFGDMHEKGKYKKIKRFGILLFQRGCPFKCAFCFRFLGDKCRFKCSKKELAEAVSAWRDFGCRDLFVADYVFGLNKKYLDCFIWLSKKFPDVKFYFQTRADLINKKTINLYKKINVGFIWLGIESFSGKIHKIINKYKKVDCIFSAINMLNNSNLNYGGFIQFGLPGETIKSINKNLYYIDKLKIPYTSSIILHTPLYGTKTYDWAKKQYLWIGNNWNDISAVRGLVKNKVYPSMLLRLVRLLIQNKKFS